MTSRTIALTAAVVAVASAWTAAQTEPARPASPPRASNAPRLADGRPDLQGTWNFATLTPLQRPSDLAGKTTLSDEEIAGLVQRAEARRTAADSAALPAGSVGGYNQFWYEPGTSVSADKRSSLIIDPPDGRIPALTPEAQKRVQANRDRLRRPADGPEDRDAPERCLLGYNSGPPMVPGGYNQNAQLVQTGDYLMILNEMVHDARIVPLDGRARMAGDVRPWMGESRGHWEGDTLVVETRGFKDIVWNQFNQWNMASTDAMRLTERFTRVSPQLLHYEFTVSDPGTWTRPWTAALLMERTDELIYEYACHEGNYGMQGILRGARMLEKVGTGTQSRSTPTR